MTGGEVKWLYPGAEKNTLVRQKIYQHLLTTLCLIITKIYATRVWILRGQTNPYMEIPKTLPVLVSEQ